MSSWEGTRSRCFAVSSLTDPRGESRKRRAVFPRRSILALLVLAGLCCSGLGSTPHSLTAPVPSLPDSSLACSGPQGCAAKSDLIRRIYLLGEGARPRWSPDGTTLVYDRENPDGYFDVYRMDVSSRHTTSLTEGNAGIGQRHNGNAAYHPSGRVIVFISEEEGHFIDSAKWMANPCLGLFSNLWACDPEGSQFWKLTGIPVKKNLFDRTPAIAVVNPLFSPDGSRLVWTERYEGPRKVERKNNWGRWRIKTADFVIRSGEPRLERERVVYTPARGNYVTAMGFFDASTLLLAGNLDGQHEYGMDQYAFDMRTGALSNLYASPESWEEGATIAPDGRIFVFMSNATSRHKLDFDDADWHRQPVEREYWISDRDGKVRRRLTFFNDPTAPEYMGRRVIVAACSASPDGERIAATLGVDYGDEDEARVRLYLCLIELAKPLGPILVETGTLPPGNPLDAP